MRKKVAMSAIENPNRCAFRTMFKRFTIARA
jgi:hypothetical protein